MQIKKDLLLSTALLILSGCLLFAAKADATIQLKAEKPCPAKISCCKKMVPAVQKSESPWNFVTQGLLHTSA